MAGGHSPGNPAQRGEAAVAEQNAAVGAATTSAARTAAAASVLAIAAVARRRVLLMVLSIRTSVIEEDAMLVSSLVRVGSPAVRTQRARGSVRKRTSPVEQGKRQQRRRDTATATDLLRMRRPCTRSHQ